jgi:hypothetical protein
MTEELNDNALDELLSTGSLSADVTDAARRELERLSATASSLRRAASVADDEARASMPTARARFQRYMEASGRPAQPVRAAAPRRGLLGGLFHAHRFLTPIVSAGVIGVLAVAAVFVSQAVFSETPSANAQVLNPGDYVQVQGVVSQATGEGDTRQIQLRSEFDDLNVDISADTALVDGSSTSAAALKPGDLVLVGGVVGKDGRIAARTVAPGGVPGAPPERVKFKELRDLRANLQGKVVTLTVAPDGSKGVVLIDGGDGQQYMVRLDGKSAEALLNSVATAVGARVQVGPGEQPGQGMFSIEVKGEPPAGQLPKPPAFSEIRGIVTGRTANVLQIDTPRGPVSVLVRLDTRFLLGESGLAREALRGDGASIIGHSVAVTGGLDRGTGRIVADLIVVGPRPPR